MLILGDCLEESNKIESGSVDLILTDLPYGTIKGLGGELEKYKRLSNSQWDNIIDTISIKHTCNYTGRKEVINILPRLIGKYKQHKQFESHLQAYLIQNIDNISIFRGLPIEWVGNEVSCGVGMQRIDIMLSVNFQNRKVIPIELKSDTAYPEITFQIQRYIDWIQQYYLPNRPSDIEPMIISREIIDKKTIEFTNVINSYKLLNQRNNILKLRYIEFSIDIQNQTINFNEVNY